ncbi:hypothetical protein NDU88_005532 [Pleurodeles waltl]|uniref:Uncharacterized protein n=1 Tax=Pleurodeles waltl TaxID=8319 RepID=A0AAV7MWL9_PLEWA|nr:hypothetical protein NDU88_005532 [Pleurodeles waltl]
MTRDYTSYSAVHNTYVGIDYYLSTPPYWDSELMPPSDHYHCQTMLQCICCYCSSRAKRHTSLKLITAYLQTNDTGHTPLASVWEALKLVIRGELTAISADSHCRKEKRAALDKEVADLESAHKPTGAHRVWRDLENAQLHRCLYQDLTEHAILSHKHKFYLSSKPRGTRACASFAQPDLCWVNQNDLYWPLHHDSLQKRRSGPSIAHCTRHRAPAVVTYQLIFWILSSLHYLMQSLQH